jgi:tRNA threonylcarbamoyl adenosine modification protein YeaZ
MILAFDTSGEQCTAALFDGDDALIARADEAIGRGHAERLVPMLSALLGSRRPDRIAVGVGPGSFTGLRVAIAAAHGLAIGWGAGLTGFSSLALIAAATNVEDDVAVAIVGGHGQYFVQEFAGRTFEPMGDAQSLVPAHAAQAIRSERVAGSAASGLIDARGFGIAVEAVPAAADLFRLPRSLRELEPRPLYVRPPDAKVKAA